MKKIMLLCMTLLLVFLSSCAYDLEEKEGIYRTSKPVEVAPGECEHHFNYSLVILYADTNIYPVSRYHYVECAKYGVDPICDFHPRCEEHDLVDAPGGIPGTMVAYNGHTYQSVQQKCTICGQMAGKKYVLAETGE